MHDCGGTAKCQCLEDIRLSLDRLETLPELCRETSIFPHVVQTIDTANHVLELSLSSCDLQTGMHMTTILYRDVLALAFDGLCSLECQPLAQQCHSKKVGVLERTTE